MNEDQKTAYEIFDAIIGKIEKGKEAFDSLSAMVLGNDSLKMFYAKQLLDEGAIVKQGDNYVEANGGQNDIS